MGNPREEGLREKERFPEVAGDDLAGIAGAGEVHAGVPLQEQIEMT